MLLCNRMQDILCRDSICITHDDDLRICTDSLDMDRVLHANDGYHKARCNVLLSLQLYHAVLCYALRCSALIIEYNSFTAHRFAAYLQ